METKLFSAKSIHSGSHLIQDTIKQTYNMKLIKTPETHYFDSGLVEFSTSRKDGELYYTISQWLGNRTALVISEEGKVKDEAHLNELQSVTRNKV